jgi:hypothetical protein
MPIPALAFMASGVYGQAMSSSKREANGRVVEMVLKPVARMGVSRECVSPLGNMLNVCWFSSPHGRVKFPISKSEIIGPTMRPCKDKTSQSF